MTIQDIKDQNLILFEVISGSRAYGTHKPTSDTDIRGVFIAPIEIIFGFNYVDQIADLTNDTVYYEVRKFLQLLQVNNPNILELLNVSEESILYKHPLFDIILKHSDKFLSKVCRDSFGGYAVAQIQKARGLNKKIVNPMAQEKKSILDFCYLADDESDSSVSLRSFLKNVGGRQESCGLTKINHMENLYFLYYDFGYIPYDYKNYGITRGYRGIVNEDDTSTELRLSSIPKDTKSIGIISYNKDGYSKYCKDYREYWDWVEKRNPDRYETNISHGKPFDSKNMMHCIRLIRMTVEIAVEKKIIVKRPDAAELMKIRNGDVDFDVLLEEAEAAIKNLDVLYQNSDLPDTVDKDFVNDLLIEIRKKFYGQIDE